VDRDRANLLARLADSEAYLRASAAAYDSGFEAEANRLAVTLRVLLYDNKNSQSLLSLLGVKDQLLFVDTAREINQLNMMPTLSLVSLRFTYGVGGRYEPRGNPEDWGETMPRQSRGFEDWWKQVVIKRGEDTWVRRQLVLVLAHKEGGAHVDPKLDAWFDDLVNRNGLGLMSFHGEIEEPFEGSPVAASVRQMVSEVQQTLDNYRSLLT